MRKPWHIKVTQVCRSDADLRRARGNGLDDKPPVSLIQLGQHIVQQQDWRLTGLRLQEIDFGKFGGDQGQALLPSRAKSPEVCPTKSEGYVVSMRPDCRHSPAQLLWSRIAERAGKLGRHALLKSGCLRSIPIAGAREIVEGRQAVWLVDNFQRINSGQPLEVLSSQDIETGDIQGAFA